jgi:hypothetical protein
MLYQASVFTTYYTANSYQRVTSEILFYCICQKWCQSDVDSQYSKELLENLKSCGFSKIHSIKTYDFSTLSTTIPHNKLKCKIFHIIDNCFLNKTGTRKYKFLVIGKQDTYFVRRHSDSPYKYSEADIKGMLGFLVDNIYVVFCNQDLPTISWHSYGH